MANHADNRNRIFISYRRDDSAAESGRIYDRLVQEFGTDSVFKDIDSIPLGVNFKHHIDSIIRKCDVVLVVIGQEWTGTQAGQSRLDNPRDLVRLEVEAALQRDIPVIPVFIDNASIESEESLPPSMIELLDRNGIGVGHDPHFHPDMNRLIKDLKRIFAPLSKTPPQIQPQISFEETKSEPKPESKSQTKEEVKESTLSNYSDSSLNFLSNFIRNYPGASVILCSIFLGIGTLILGSYDGLSIIAATGIKVAFLGVSAGIILALWRAFRGKR